MATNKRKSTIANISLNGKMLKIIFLRVLSKFLQESLATTVRQGKEINVIRLGKVEIIILLLAGRIFM